MNLLRSTRILAGVASIAICGLMGPSVASGSITMDLDFEFSGADDLLARGAPGPPWLRAIFEDIAPGTIRLTMNALNLIANEFIDEWSFNLNPVLDPTFLNFAPVNVSAVGAVTISTGVNAFQADGDGSYDIHFDFPQSNSGGGAMRFKAGESVIYDITYDIPGVLVEGSFNFQSQPPSGGNGFFNTAAHIQGIGTGGGASDWIGEDDPVVVPPGTGIGGASVPEAASLIVWSLLMGAVGLVSQRRRQSIVA